MREELLTELIEYVGVDYTAEMDTFLLMLIDDATDEVCQEMYPYGFSSDSEEEKAKTSAMTRYKSKIRKIAQFHYDKQGKEGIQSFSENSTSVSYESSGTPASYLRGIIPVATIV